MEKRIDIRQALRVFDKVMSHGEKTSDGRRLNNIIADSDFDGYTVYLRSNNVMLAIFFHNTFHLNYDKKEELDIFFRALNEIDALSI